MPIPRATLFETTPEKQAELTVADAYSDLNTQSLADPVASLTNGAVNILNEVFKQDTLLEISKDLGEALVKKKLDVGVAQDILGKVLGDDIKGDIIGLGYSFGNNLLKSAGFGGASDSIIKGLLGLPGGQRPEQWFLNQNPKLQIALNQGTQIFKLVQNGLDAKSAGNAINLIQRFTKDTMGLDVIDITAKSNVFKSVLDVAGKFKIPEVLDKAFDSLKAGEKREVILGNLAAGVTSNGITYLKKAAELYDGPDIFSKAPDILKTTLNSFGEALGETKDEAIAQITQLDTLFSKVDPEWKQKLIKGQPVLNMDVLIKANDAAIKQFSLVHDNAAPEDLNLAINAVISAPFKKETFLEVVTKMYPSYLPT